MRVRSQTPEAAKFAVMAAMIMTDLRVTAIVESNFSVAGGVLNKTRASMKHTTAGSIMATKLAPCEF